MSDRHIATIPVFQPAQVPHAAAEMDSVREVQVECRKWMRTVVCAAAWLHLGSLIVLSNSFRAAQCVFQLLTTHRLIVLSLWVCAYQVVVVTSRLTLADLRTFGLVCIAGDCVLHLVL